MSRRVAYLDASALVKLVIDEPGGPELRRYLADFSARATSVVSQVEVPRAVGRKLGSTPPEARAALDSADVIQLESEIVAKAGRIEPDTLRSLDAIHLASALQLAPELDAFVTYDHRLADAARAVGLPVTSPGAAEASGT